MCDGGNELLSRGPQWGTKHVGKVINSFLQEHPAISFVLTIVVKQRLGGQPYCQVITTLYTGVSFDSVGKEIVASIDRLAEAIPKPERDAANAINLVKGSVPHEGRSFYGGWTITPDEIKISARTLLGFFAGRISQEAFSNAYHFMPGGAPSSDTWNPFERKLQAGRLVHEVVVERPSGERDDEWLVFRFGPPDPAVTQFTRPESRGVNKSKGGKGSVRSRA